MHGDVVHPAVPSITSPDTSLKWSQSGVRVPLKLVLVHALSVSASRTLLSVTEAAVNRNQATVDQARPYSRITGRRPLTYATCRSRSTVDGKTELWRYINGIYQHSSSPLYYDRRARR